MVTNGKGWARSELYGADVHLVISTVSDAFNLTTAQLTGKSRRKEVALARGIAYYLARECTGAPQSALGPFFGGRERTTVGSGASRMARRIESDPKLADVVKRIRAEVERCANTGE